MHQESHWFITGFFAFHLSTCSFQYFTFHDDIMTWKTPFHITGLLWGESERVLILGSHGVSLPVPFKAKHLLTGKHIDGLEQNCSMSSELALEILQSCTAPLAIAIILAILEAVFFFCFFSILTSSVMELSGKMRLARTQAYTITDLTWLKSDWWSYISSSDATELIIDSGFP